MKHFIISALLLSGSALAYAAPAQVCSPAGNLCVTVNTHDGTPRYSVTLDGKEVLMPSRLGFVTDFADFSKGIQLVDTKITHTEKEYVNNRIKRSHNKVNANNMVCTFANEKGQKFEVEFHVADNDVAFRYRLPRQNGRGSVRVMDELTSFRFPEATTTFLTPQSDAMIGWKRSKPSYEEEYTLDAKMDTPSQYGHGYTFPGLFKVGDDAWVLVSETGLDRNYCASRLSDWSAAEGYEVEFPMPEENNGNGTVEPAFALPGNTPWRTLTIGSDLAPIVETTIPFDVVEPRYPASFRYDPGKGTWSWIVWQDDSMNREDQIAFVDLAADLGYDHILVDAGWDQALGKEGTEELVRYARSKGVDVFLWLSSSGYWNDIQQSPINIMDNPIMRKKALKWMHSLGVKGIKVDFFGGDKQETIRLYEDILSDADDNGLMVIFHGCTLPRGWEQMYPNYVGSEAILASENLVFQQHFCDEMATNTTTHPFIRNAVGSMEFGGTFLNKNLNRNNDGGTRRRTSDTFELATAVLFQSPAQNFALTPQNLTDSPEAAIRFMKNVPTTWDDIRFIDGYPGKYVVMARRHDNRWYVAGVNAEDKPVTVTIDPKLFLNGAKNGECLALTDGVVKKGNVATATKAALPAGTDYPLNETTLRVAADKPLKMTIQPQGGFVLIF